MGRRRYGGPSDQEIKDAVRKRDGCRCRGCGMSADEHLATYSRQLDVHRTVPGSPYSIDGCVTLCRKCHGPQPRLDPGARDLAHPRINVTHARLYADIPEDLKRRLDRMAQYHSRKIGAEVALALKRYLDAEEKKAGDDLPPLEES